MWCFYTKKNSLSSVVIEILSYKLKNLATLYNGIWQSNRIKEKDAHWLWKYLQESFRSISLIATKKFELFLVLLTNRKTNLRWEKVNYWNENYANFPELLLPGGRVGPPSASWGPLGRWVLIPRNSALCWILGSFWKDKTDDIIFY